jgi:hypothetical protein
VFERAADALRSAPPRKASRNRQALLIGGAFAMLAVAASTVLLVAQATRLERSLRAG